METSGGNQSDRAQYVPSQEAGSEASQAPPGSPELSVDPSDGGPMVVAALAFLTVVAWGVASVVTVTTYRGEAYEEGFIDPLVYDLWPWYLAATGLTAVTVTIGLAVIANLIHKQASRL